MREDPRSEWATLRAGVCQALADPSRLLILEELRHGERTISDLQAAVGLGQSNVSRHVAKLRERGLVRTRRHSIHVYCSLQDPRVLQALKLLDAALRDFLGQQSAQVAALPIVGPTGKPTRRARRAAHREKSLA